MEKEFLPYELALRMKELGFEERCFTRYYESGKLADSLSYLHHNYFGQVNAPTFSQAFRWFREKYDLTISIKRNRKYKTVKRYEVTIDASTDDKFDIFGMDYYDSYEQAELACLTKLIEIVEQKNAEMTDHGVYK
jgi:hypothetical protein